MDEYTEYDDYDAIWSPMLTHRPSTLSKRELIEMAERVLPPRTAHFPPTPSKTQSDHTHRVLGDYSAHDVRTVSHTGANGWMRNPITSPEVPANTVIEALRGRTETLSTQLELANEEERRAVRLSSTALEGINAIIESDASVFDLLEEVIALRAKLFAMQQE